MRERNEKDGPACEECEDVIDGTGKPGHSWNKRRTRCVRCGRLVCSYCFHHGRHSLDRQVVKVA